MKCSTCGKMNCYVHGGAVHHGGIHDEEKNGGKSVNGVSKVGAKLRELPSLSRDKHFESSEDIKSDHEEALHELKSLPKPKLKGLAEGGEVEHQDMGEESDHELMDMCAGEFMDGHEKKDKRQMLDALKAIWHSSKE